MSTSKAKRSRSKVGKTKATKLKAGGCVLFQNEAKQGEMIVAINYAGNTHLVKVINIKEKLGVFLHLRTMFTKELAETIADSLTE